MKWILAVCCLLAFSVQAKSGEIILKKVQGEVTVRRGVTEGWAGVRPGEVLPPDATIRTGPRSSAVLFASNKTVTLQSDVIVDMSDVRDLSPEELMLKLTMERVRASSYEWKNNELNIPNTTVVHGTDGGRARPLAENDIADGNFLLNGTRALFDNGFYSTCALKTLEVLRRYPPLGARFEHRWLASEALEKAGLRERL